MQYRGNALARTASKAKSPQATLPASGAVFRLLRGMSHRPLLLPPAGMRCKAQSSTTESRFGMEPMYVMVLFDHFDEPDNVCPQLDGERLDANEPVPREEASLADLLLDLSGPPIAELQPEAPPPLEPPVQEPAAHHSRPMPPLTGIPQIDAAQIFVNMLRDNPRLEDSLLSEDAIRQLREPITQLATITPDERLAIRMYLADSQGSYEIYTANRSAVLERHPDDEILTLHLVKKKIAQLTGVYALSHDMCPSSCMAYTGPWAALEECRYCPKPRYETVVVKKKTVKKAH